MKDKISIIGAGSWGTTLAVVLAKKGVEVSLHSVFAEHNQQMYKDRENKLFLKGTRFPSTLSIESVLATALTNKIIVIAIPVKFVKKVLKTIKQSKVVLADKIFVSVSKGIEDKTLKRVSQIIKEELGNVHVAVLSGPNISSEVLKEIPSTSLLACHNEEIAKKLQALFTTANFRIYNHHDIVGVELGGALKNIIAIACGISDGLGFGTNTKAALVTRGLVEITRLAKTQGAHPSTFWGISGMGDLVTTCFSPQSRNRFVGEQIGKGKTLKQVLDKMKMVAEGVETVKPAYLLSKRLHVDAPIIKEVYNILYKNKPPRKAVCDLMTRPLKPEIVG